MKKPSSFLKNNALVRFFIHSLKDQYKPEKHYMRGPGPKAKAKLNGGSMNGASAQNETPIIRD